MFIRNIRGTMALAITTAVLAGCSEPGTPASSDAAPASTPAAAQAEAPLEQRAQTAVAGARAVYDQSVNLGFAWRAAGQQLSAAEQALAAADHNAALELALEAQQLAQASIVQAETEATAWQNRAPFN